VIGILAIENGGRVNSNTAAVGFGSDSSGSLVTIDGRCAWRKSAFFMDD
jgi:hypothetical protein